MLFPDTEMGQLLKITLKYDKRTDWTYAVKTVTADGLTQGAMLSVWFIVCMQKSLATE